MACHEQKGNNTVSTLETKVIDNPTIYFYISIVCGYWAYICIPLKKMHTETYSKTKM